MAIPEEEFALYQTLKPVMEKLKELIAASDSSKDEKIAKFITQLDQNISKLRGNILEVRTLGQHHMVIFLNFIFGNALLRYRLLIRIFMMCWII